MIRWLRDRFGRHDQPPARDQTVIAAVESSQTELSRNKVLVDELAALERSLSAKRHRRVSSHL